jgi:hypothetical protein
MDRWADKAFEKPVIGTREDVYDTCGVLVAKIQMLIDNPRLNVQNWERVTEAVDNLRRDSNCPKDVKVLLDEMVEAAEAIMSKKRTNADTTTLLANAAILMASRPS